MRRILPSFQEGPNVWQQLKKSQLRLPLLAFLLATTSLQAQVTVTLDVVEPCFGLPTGMITALPDGGTAPYEYLWSTGDTTETINGLAAGTYSVTVTDAGGLTATQSVTTEYDEVQVTLEAQECEGPYTITATVIGGEGPFWYDWSNGDEGETIEVEPGYYCITLTDNNKCAQVECITVDPQPISLNIKTRDGACPGVNDGEMNVEVTGGHPPFSYLWSNGETTRIIRNLAPGSYTVTVTDSSGCTAEASGTIADQDPILIDIAGQGPVCIDDANGLVTTSVTGGTAPYTYLWNTGQATSSLTNLTVGLYEVTVTDANGCEAVDSIELTPRSNLTVSIDATGQLCPDGREGTATAVPVGGVTPYLYMWSTGETTRMITGLPDGTYSVTVTDAEGCQASAEVVIEPAPDFEISLTTEDVTSCLEDNGSAEVTVIAGVMPYAYQWSNGATTAKVEGLAAGTYSVTVTNGNDCELIRFVTIVDPPDVFIETGGTDLTCPDSNDGTATVAVMGGTPPYTYAWSNGANTADISGLAQGIYTVTVTDANDCTAIDSVSIGKPSAINLTVTGRNLACAGDQDGIVRVEISGGAPEYQILWSNGATGAIQTGLPGGLYAVTVTDANGCTAESSITLTEPDPLTISLSVVDVLCGGETTGSIASNVSGGTGNYTYAWSDGSSSANLSGIGAGTYSVTVTDENDCTAVATTTVNEPPVLELQIRATLTSCVGGSDGTATVAADGGTTPYTFAWSNGETTAMITGLTAGTYQVTVTDANGCRAVRGVEIREPAPIVVTLSAVDILCAGEATGAVTSSVSGGTGDYSYAWSNGADTADLSNVSAGTYTVTVTDENGCTGTASVTVNEPPALEVQISSTPVTCAGFLDGTAAVTTGGGTSPYTFAWSNGDITASITGLGAGTYRVTVTDANGCQAVRGVEVDEPARILVNLNAVDVLCAGEATGSVTSSVSGGTGAYTYSWSNGATSANLNDLGADTYSVTVTDENGCTASASVAVREPAALETQVEATSVSCAGFADGQASVMVSGGQTPYTYLWSNGETASVLMSLGPGVYNVTVTDANGCQSVNEATITEPPVLEVQAKTVQDACANDANGAATATAIGGTPGYSYSWSNGQTGPDLQQVPAGDYTVVVTDANGCRAESTVTIASFENPVCEATVISDVTDSTNPNGAAEVSVSGGKEPYTYLWSDGQMTARAENLSAGSYTVTVTDANDCTSVCEVTIRAVVGLGDYVWEDLDRDGIQDDNEPPLQDIEVKLKDANGNVIATTQTDINGKYSFIGLMPGTYSVMFVLPPGFRFTGLNEGMDDALDSDANPGMDGMTATVTLGDGEYNPTIDAGITLAPESEFTGVCNCLNNATTEDNGQFLETVTIISYPGETWTVIRADNMFAADSPEPPAAPNPLPVGAVLQDLGDGEYQIKFRVVDDLFFTGLFSNGTDTITLRNICTYPTINASLPNGELCITDPPFPLTASPSVPGTVVFTLDGEVVTEIDPASLGVGAYELIVSLLPDDVDECEAVIVKTIVINDACLSMVGDFVWLDIDRDGIQDPGEPGIPGVEVIISSADGTFNETTFTDVNGLYKFTVPNGDYKITFVKPEDLIASPKDVGSNNEVDSDADPVTGMTDIFTLGDGVVGVNEMEMDFTWDAGFVSPCENVTDPGEVGYDQMICGPGVDPEPFVSIRDASGGEGAIEYLWMMSTQEGPFDPDLWTSIPNSNTPDFDPGPVYYTTYYARCARREGCISFLETKIVKVIVKEDAVARISGPEGVCQGQGGTFTSLEHGAGAEVRWEIERLGNVIASGDGPEFTYDFPSTGNFYVVLYVTENDCTSTARHRVSVTTNPTICSSSAFTIDATAMEDQRAVRVVWQMQPDHTTQHYVIEYSADGVQFDSLSEVEQPVRTENGLDHYAFIHETPKTGWNYYRVNMKDGWGNRAVSDIADVVIYADSKLLIAYPNPVKDVLVLELFDFFNTDVTLDIFSISGVRIGQIELKDDQQRQTIDFSSYPAGAYFLRVRYGDANLKVVHIIKQ